MKAVVQHNFTSGLGDFISDLSQCMSVLYPLKTQGYNIHLIISLGDNKYIKDSFFNSLFDKETKDFFDSIVELDSSILTLEYDGCKYYSSNHDPQRPGVHHFDIFFDVIPNNFQWLRFDAQRAVNNVLPTVLPKFSNLVMNRVESFWKTLPKEYSFLHIRTSDQIDKNNNRYNKIIENIKIYLKQNDIKFHLGTNNKFIYNSLKEEKNIYTYEFKNYEIVDNDMNAFTYRTQSNQFNKEILNERLLDIATELVSIQNAKKIYYLHDVYWISNFLFYPICITKNKIPLINKNEWSN